MILAVREAHSVDVGAGTCGFRYVGGGVTRRQTIATNMTAATTPSITPAITRTMITVIPTATSMTMTIKMKILIMLL